ncbi:16S rRNA (cytosine(1402)-N(4))-methyltransferase RsmH [Patescibacteria group bacterium]|nr:16S rRNA (cytosine(1402)-N(4))-methyltransferase RsmH [Patescibacteria group bacterium]
MKTNHITVFLNQAVELLNVKADRWYVDATFGGGGHTRNILSKDGYVLAFDFDERAIEMGNEEFASEIASHKLVLVQENFANLEKTIKAHQLEGKIDGLIFDFGTSTDQLMSEERGFSFSGLGELDMRMDKNLGVKAKDLLALLSEKQLTEVFSTYGGELEAKKIAKAIVAQRKAGKFISTNQDLVKLVEKNKSYRGKTHPATKVFQALRIVVNDELANIEHVLPQALKVINSGSRIVTIGFHEGEDRQVKVAFRNWEEKGFGTIVTKKAIEPSEEEVQNNPRSRSAKLRAFEKNEKNIA